MKKNSIEFEFYDEKVSLVPSVELYKVRDCYGTKLPGLAVAFFDEIAEEPFAVLTVSFGEFISVKNAAYVDVNNVPEYVQKFCLESGIAKQTAFTKHSGYVEYPLWVFDENWLREIGGKKYEEYSKSFENYVNGSGEC